MLGLVLDVGITAAMVAYKTVDTTLTAVSEVAKVGVMVGVHAANSLDEARTFARECRDTVGRVGVAADAVSAHFQSAKDNIPPAA